KLEYPLRTEMCNGGSERGPNRLSFHRSVICCDQSPATVRTSKSHDVSDAGQGMNRAIPDEGSEPRFREMLGPQTAVGRQILGGLRHHCVSESPIPFAPRRNGSFSKDGQESHMRARHAPPHFVENAGLVAHRAPRVGEARREIKACPDPTRDSTSRSRRLRRSTSIVSCHS